MRTWLSAAVIVCLLALPATPCRAFLIDDFTQGETTLSGPAADLVQTGLDPALTAGGERRLFVTNAGDLVSISAQEGLRYTPSSGAYGFEVVYGDASSLGIDLVESGYDRVVIKFTGSAEPAARLNYLTATGSPEGLMARYSFGTALFSLGEYGAIEFPLNGLTMLDRLSIDFNRALSSGGFVIEEVSLAGQPLAGDYNRDGQVDALDYEEWRRQYGGISLNGSQVAGLFTADGNQDGRVNAADYVIWRDNLPASTPLSLPIPEPAAAALLFASFTLMRRSFIKRAF